MASIILLRKHYDALVNEGIIRADDEIVIVFVEVMYDLSRNISAHNPETMDFIYKCFALFEKWGYRVEHLRSKNKDFITLFNHRLTRSSVPARIGKRFGFPLSTCYLRREAKIKVIEQWKKSNVHDDDLNVLGIAIDEPRRLESLHKQSNTISLLEHFGYTEEMAYKLCEEHNLLSPQYFLGSSQKRDGCWCCPWAKLPEYQAIKERYPEVWSEYVALQDLPDLAFPKHNVYSKLSLREIDKLI